jgi:7-cyano-7-deazaguanine synthase
MCGIFGWQDPGLQAPKTIKHDAIDAASRRGRDGVGVSFDLGAPDRMLSAHAGKFNERLDARYCVGVYRATPTPEPETKLDILGPYGSPQLGWWIHNGTIANDDYIRDQFNVPEHDPFIDSMVIPHLMEGITSAAIGVDRLSEVEGSFAMAGLVSGGAYLYLAANYKPLYWLGGDGWVVFSSNPFATAHPIEPYSVMKFGAGVILGQASLYGEVDRPRSVLVSASSGLDSTTVAYMLRDQGYDVDLAHFHYGANATRKEWERIRQISEHGRMGLVEIEIPKGIVGGTLVEGRYHDEPIRGAEYAEDWVSARNLLMLSLLTAKAERDGYDCIAFGGNLEESGAYPDNEEEFARRFNAILPFAVAPDRKIELLTPVVRMMKHEIVKEGLRLKVPYHLTWSCYSGKEEHCGVCGPCFMRREAFRRSGIEDPVFKEL